MYKKYKRNSKFNHEIIIHNNGSTEPSKDFIRTMKLIILKLAIMHEYLRVKI